MGLHPQCNRLPHSLLPSFVSAETIIRCSFPNPFSASSLIWLLVMLTWTKIQSQHGTANQYVYILSTTDIPAVLKSMSCLRLLLGVFANLTFSGDETAYTKRMQYDVNIKSYPEYTESFEDMVVCITWIEKNLLQHRHGNKIFNRSRLARRIDAVAEASENRC